MRNAPTKASKVELEKINLLVDPDGKCLGGEEATGQVGKLQELFGNESEKILFAVNQVLGDGKPRVVNIAVDDSTTVALIVVPAVDRPRKAVVLGTGRLSELVKAETERREREKELACLFEVGQLIEDSDTVEEYFDKLPAILKAGFLEPDCTNVYIKYRGIEVGERPPQEAETLHASFTVGGEHAGGIWVWLSNGKSFLSQEHKMMAEVARMTSKALEKYEQGLELERNLRLLKSILKAIPDRIVLLDTDYRIQISNDRRTRAIGKRCYEFYYHRSKPCDDCPVTKALKEAKSAKCKRRSGRRVFMLDAHPVVNERGEVEGVVELVRDITQEERIQEQLIHADKMASLGQLTAGVAHEINNPIQFIKENVRIVKETLQDVLPILEREWKQNPDLRIARLPYPFFKRHIMVLVDDMEKGAARIRDIVASLKQFARNDDGSLNETVDLKKAIESSLRLTHNQVKKTATVELEVDEDLPKIRGNAQKIEQVLVNIIINACQAIAQKQKSEGDSGYKGKIWISAKYDKDHSNVIISIKDNGPGIRHDIIRRIFDPFFTTKHDSGGTGLGLSIAYGIIKEHKGSIEVESQYGHGAEFRIILPAMEEEENEQQDTNS